MSKLFSFLGDPKRLKNSSEAEVLISPLPSRYAFYKSLRFKDSGNSMEMAVDGSSTVSFKIQPSANEIMFVDYISLFLLHTGVFGPKVFASLGDALTTGILVNQKTNGIISEITIMFDNSDIFQCFFGAQASPQTGAISGVFESIDWMGGRMDFENAVILDANKGDFLEIQIRDNLEPINADGGLLRASAGVKTVINF